MKFKAPLALALLILSTLLASKFSPKERSLSLEHSKAPLHTLFKSATAQFKSLKWNFYAGMGQPIEAGLVPTHLTPLALGSGHLLSQNGTLLYVCLNQLLFLIPLVLILLLLIHSIPVTLIASALLPWHSVSMDRSLYPELEGDWGWAWSCAFLLFLSRRDLGPARIWKVSYLVAGAICAIAVHSPGNLLHQIAFLIFCEILIGIAFAKIKKEPETPPSANQVALVCFQIGLLAGSLPFFQSFVTQWKTLPYLWHSHLESTSWESLLRLDELTHFTTLTTGGLALAAQLGFIGVLSKVRKGKSERSQFGSTVLLAAIVAILASLVIFHPFHLRSDLAFPETNFYMALFPLLAVSSLVAALQLADPSQSSKSRQIYSGLIALALFVPGIALPFASVIFSDSNAPNLSDSKAGRDISPIASPKGGAGELLLTEISKKEDRRHYSFSTALLPNRPSDREILDLRMNAPYLPASLVTLAGALNGTEVSLQSLAQENASFGLLGLNGSSAGSIFPVSSSKDPIQDPLFQKLLILSRVSLLSLSPRTTLNWDLLLPPYDPMSCKTVPKADVFVRICPLVGGVGFFPATILSFPAENDLISYFQKSDAKSLIGFAGIRAEDEKATPHLQRAAKGKVVSVVRGINEISYGLEVSEGGLFVLSDLNFPGWKAYDGEKSIPIFQVNLAFKGVLVSPETHQLSFRFD